METFILYGLVVVFFLALLLFAIIVLSAHPYTERVNTPTVEVQAVDSTNTKIAYVLLSLLLISLVVLTFLNQRKG